MKYAVSLFCLCSLITINSASAQSLRSKCLNSLRAGDATVNCHKASLLVQQQQLELLLEIRNALLTDTNRLLSQITKNTGQTTVGLNKLTALLNPLSSRPTGFLLVKNPAEFTESRFECLQDPTCEADAQTTAENICKRLGFERQQALEYKRDEITNGTSQITWVVCQQ